MRSLLIASMTLGLSLMLGGCCGKKDNTSSAAASNSAPTAATTAVHAGQVEPVGCRGMKTLADCQGCCDPKYWTASFQHGQCACVKK